MRRIVLVLLLVVSLVSGSRVFACAMAPHAGDQVRIAEESAVIVWDPAAQTEHFIRRATFEGGERDFGFLVPTPTVPRLEAVSDQIFDTLVAVTAPETVEKHHRTIDWTPLLVRLFSRGEGVPNAGVAVISTAKMGGYELVVLAAGDARALHRWLERHGYAASADLDAWVAPYLSAGWMITAFKVDPSQHSSSVRTEAVRMSFTTPRPFFPYREPASQRLQRYGSSARVLRLFVVAPDRMRGTIGTSTAWPGVVQWSDAMDATTRARLGWAVGRDVPETTRLTAFVDTSSIRENDDLYFVPDGDQLPLKPPNRIRDVVDTVHLPADVIAALVLGLALVVRRARRAR